MTTNGESDVPAPRWVKVQGVLVALLMLVVVSMSTGLLGRHGDGHSEGAALKVTPSTQDYHRRRHQ